jgi:hypothetical protein
LPITFSTKDVNLASFPHTNAMVVTIHIDRWDVTKILIDNGSQAQILFLTAFKKMGYDRKQLKEPMKLLYGFNGKKSNQLRSSPYPSHLAPRKTLTQNTLPLMSLTCSTLTMSFLEEASSTHSKLPYSWDIFVLRSQQPSAVYPFLAVNKMLEISRRASCPGPKMCIFCEKS